MRIERYERSHREHGRHTGCGAGLVLAVALAGAVTPMSGRAQTSQTGSADTPAYACYVPGTGTVYRIRTVKAPASCTSPEHIEFVLGGTADQLKAAGGGNKSPADHGSLGGLLDDDHPQYLLAEGVRSSLAGFAVTGTLGTGGIPATGAGTRLMWYPGKAALRAGSVQNVAWDDPNIGEASVGLGRNPYSSGVASTAIGYNTFATGDGSTAIGLGTVASGRGATAFGESSQATGENASAIGHIATAFGDFSTAIGVGATANSFNGVAIGHYADTNNQSGAMVLATLVQSDPNPVKAVAAGQFVARATRFWFGNTRNVTAPAGQLIVTSTGAYLSTGGTWVNSSDVNRKENFLAVDADDVLDALAKLPIQTWNYRDEEASVRHIGPTAQDFRAAFGLGATETAIATIDADGIALTAIQALERRVRQQASEIRELRAGLEALQSLLGTDRNSRQNR